MGPPPILSVFFFSYGAGSTAVQGKTEGAALILWVGGRGSDTTAQKVIRVVFMRWELKKKQCGLSL